MVWVRIRVSFSIIAMEIVIVHSIKMDTFISAALLLRELCLVRYWNTGATAAAIQFSSLRCTQAWRHQLIRCTTVVVIYNAMPW